MTTLDGFLLARIAEDESDAAAATPGPWDSSGWVYGSADTESYGVWAGAINTKDPRPPIAKSSRYQQGYYDAQHIARHDPARVLAECAAKQAVLGLLAVAEQHLADMHRSAADYRSVSEAEGPRDAIRCAVQVLAAVYAGHPDYQQEWQL